MKTFASIALGVAALGASAIGFAQPAAARGDVGIYVGPSGIGINVDNYRNYCSDDWYRRNHWDFCSRYSSNYYDNGYYTPYFNGFYSGGYRVQHDRDDHRNWGDHRGGDRHEDRRGGDHRGHDRH